MANKFKAWTNEQIDNYFMGIKYSDYPHIFWEKISKKIDGCHSFLDVGCGPGAFALKAAQHGMTVQAIDVNKKNLDALKKMCYSKCLKNVNTILGNWLSVKVEKADASVSAYSFVDEIGTLTGIYKILQNTNKVAFFITPYGKSKTDFLSEKLYYILGKTPNTFSGDYRDLLKIFNELGEKVQYETVEYDFGMPIRGVDRASVEKCAYYLCEKLELDNSSKSLGFMKKHLRKIITIKNGMYWVPNPKKSVMITWRR